MDSAVCFRDLEESDIDFVYRCKNNEKLWEYTIGDFHKFSYEEAVAWVQGCMRNDPTYKFWAICKNDETRDIVGWCGIDKIDFANKTAKEHGIVIGDRDYNDGFTLIDTILFLLKYVFETLRFEKLTTCWLSDHPNSSALACLGTVDASVPNGIVKNGRNHDVVFFSLSKEEYFYNIQSGNFEVRNIIQRIVSYRKNKSGLV